MLIPATIPVSIVSAACAEIPSWNFGNTAAPWWRWYLNDRPGWVARLRDRDYPLDPDHVVLIAPETNFQARSHAPATHQYFHFTVGPPFHTVRDHIVRFKCEHLRPLAERCRQAIEAEHRAEVSLLVQALCSVGLVEVGIETRPVDERILRVTELMQQNAETALSNDVLAEAAGMHPNAFIRWFKRELGATPQAWQTERRVERACSMLRYTDASIEHIAESLGFCDRYYFSRVFRRYRGCSPSTFRRQTI